MFHLGLLQQGSDVICDSAQGLVRNPFTNECIRFAPSKLGPTASRAIEAAQGGSFRLAPQQGGAAFERADPTMVTRDGKFLTSRPGVPQWAWWAGSAVVAGGILWLLSKS